MAVRNLLVATLASTLPFSMPVRAAHADTAPSTSSSTAASSDFDGGADDWTGAAGYGGLCVPALLCPAVINDWSAGGADGNGYIRTRFTSLATTLAGTSTGTWTSPPFTYNGHQGSVPGAVRVDLSTVATVDALQGAELLNTTAYSVDLVDQATGVAVNAVPATAVTGDHGWTASRSAAIDPGLLTLGHDYAFRITTSYHSVAAVQAAGQVGYDDVRLTTTTPGTDGTRGRTRTMTRKELRVLVKTYILSRGTTVSGGLLRVHLRCPANVRSKPCKVQVAGLQSGKFSKAATARKVVSLKATKDRIVKIRIKPRYVGRYQAAAKVWVRTTVRIGNVRVTVRKRITLAR